MALNAILPYHDLRNLSRSFKDNLANRLLCKLLEGINTNLIDLIFICFLFKNQVNDRVQH